MINNKVPANGAYYTELRTPMLSLITGTPKRVLEIGCAAGQTLAQISERGAEYTVGIERSPQVAEIAKARGLSKVIVGDVESLDLDFEPNSFDLLIAGHVLEHLIDPWTTLKKLRHFLRDDGQLIGALPNIRHHSVVFPLMLTGKWQYEESGVMDWTHLRFFSRQTAVDLLQSTGFEVQELVPEFGRNSQIANRLTCRIFENLLAYIYNFSAVKTNADGHY